MPTKKIFAYLVSQLCIIGLLINCETPEQSSLQMDWGRYSSDASGSKYLPLTQIDTGNVQQLTLAWTYESDDYRQSPRTTIECNPIIVDGIIYLTTPGLKVAALYGYNGEVKWTFDPYDGQQASGVNRGVTYWSDDHHKRIFYVAGANLYAINAETGTLDTAFGNQGTANLYDGLGRDVSAMWVTAATPGMIYKDLLILGSTLGEGPSAAAPGHIRAFNVRTGQQEWIFRTIPEPGEYGYETWPEDAWTHIGGANAWGGFTLDEKRGWVFCGTGSPAYDHWGGNRKGANLFGNCILALDAETGERKWHFQTVHHDIWDYDVPCPPNLVEVMVEGNLVDAIAQPTKLGHLFVLNRETGKPIHPVREVTVPQSEIPGEHTWPTQPFPIASLRYAQQVFTEAEVTTRSPEAAAGVRARLKTMDTGRAFLPPSIRGAVTLPQFNGGTDWGGAAYHPQSRTLFVNCSNEAEWISMRKATPKGLISQFELGQQLQRTLCQSCHGVQGSKYPGAPTLQVIAKEKSHEDIIHVLEHGKGSMPKFAMLSDDEKQALAAFLKGEGHQVELDQATLHLSFSEVIPYVATGHNEFKDIDGYPVNQMPWGTLSAIDLDAGKMNWQVPLGTYPQLEAAGFSETGTFNMGGPMVTDGGLVFIAATMDERFRAFHQRTGELLWSYQLEAGGYATPATYMIDGVQYIIIAAGGGGKPGTKAGGIYYCFRLPTE